MEEGLPTAELDVTVARGREQNGHLIVLFANIARTMSSFLGMPAIVGLLATLSDVRRFLLAALPGRLRCALRPRFAAAVCHCAVCGKALREDGSGQVVIYPSTKS